MLFQPPEFVKVPNTSLTVFLGARTQIMTIITKNPKTWTIIIKFWKTGIALLPQMFETQTTRVMAMTNKVPCQFA